MRVCREVVVMDELAFTFIFCGLNSIGYSSDSERVSRDQGSGGGRGTWVAGVRCSAREKLVTSRKVLGFLW